MAEEKKEQTPLYSTRPEWVDITPLDQYEIANPVAPILYDETYKDATGYFRGIVKAGEKSQRVLDLTAHIIHLNPAHYAVWQYRYDTLVAINASFDDELALMEEIATKYMKTYQVWHHRRLLITSLGSMYALRELDFIAKVLKIDTKNYHTWSYRQWLLSYFNDSELWSGELDFVDQMIVGDVRNNSAWHHRYFVVFASGVREGEEDRERVIKRELIYAKQNISLAPNNLSAWNYLRGSMESNKIPFSRVKEFVEPYTKSFDDSKGDIVDVENPPPSKGADLPCVAAIEFLADIYESSGGDSIPLAVELWKSLANEHDRIRKKYWEYRIREATRNKTESKA